MVITPSSKSDRVNGADPRELILVGRENVRSERYNSPSLKKPNILDHAIAQYALTAMRNKNTSSKHLRNLSNQLLTLLALEATRTLPTEEVSVETPEGTHKGKILSKSVIFLSLSRHGLGLCHNISESIPDVSIGSITLESLANPARLEPRLHLTYAPALNESRVILFDPVVSSGLTAGIALNMLKKSGAADLVLISFIVSSPGLKRIQATVPEISIWAGAIDEELDPKRGPLPGMGDLGKRLYSQSE